MPRTSLIAATAALVAAVAGASAAVVASRGDAATRPAPARVVRVAVDKRGIHAPATAKPGLTSFSFGVAATTDHTQSLQVVRLHDGVRYSTLVRELRSGNLGAIFRQVSGQGGISHSGRTTGHSWQTVLVPGNYLLVDDEAHLMAPLRVRGAAATRPNPSATETVVFTSAGLRVPRALRDGTWKLVNRDRITHELALISVTGGHTKGEAVRALTKGANPAWLAPVGTLNSLGPNESAWYSLRGLRGPYVLADYLPMFQGAAKRPVVTFHRF